MNISKEVWVEDLEKLADGTYKRKNHIAKARNGVTFDEHLAEKATLGDASHVKHGVLTTTLDTTWIGSSPPYTKEQTVNGITADDTPIIDVVMSGVFATDEARQENWGHIYRAVTSANKITFYATEKPEASLPIQIKVVR